MGHSKEQFMNEQESNSIPAEHFQGYSDHNSGVMPLNANNIRSMVITKSSAAEVHGIIRNRILSSGTGAIEYLEAIKYFENLKMMIYGDSSKKEGDPRKEGDVELRNEIINQLRSYGPGGFVSPRGVKFELAEVGTKYDFSHTTSWVALDAQIKELEEKKKALEARLKAIPAGVEMVDTETGEVFYGPAKSSKTSFKITISK
jgi:hypothetical protein